MARRDTFPLSPLAPRAPVALAAFGFLLGMLPLLLIGPTLPGIVVGLVVGVLAALGLVVSVRAVIGRIVVVASRAQLGLSSTREGDGNPNLFAPRPVADIRLRAGERLPLPPLGRLSLLASGTAGRRRKGTHVLISDIGAPIVIVRFADSDDVLWVTPADPDAVIRAVGSTAPEERRDA